MPSFEQEHKLFEIPGEFFFLDSEIDAVGDEVRALDLPPLVESSWIRFFDSQTEALGTQDSSLHDWTILPKCESDQVQKAFTSIAEETTHVKYLALSQALKTFSQTQSTGGTQ
ncbi:hypothetical protein OC834_007238, partial [Tilletia horrida]